ncbi:MAG: hypothetical protein LKG25_03675 [Prevotella sp.]|jgi:hypothetical protein|nr:hypothetical protein [Prevotella sp.]MCI1281678.1 hypothetical protein [Prevotella sp.]
MKENVDSFAVHYFNWQFKESLPYCTAESGKWLRYAASQVHQPDIDILRTKSEGAGYELGDITYHDDDTTANIIINVKNYLCMDTIGKAGRLTEKATFSIPLVYRGEKWKIKMEGLPRSEKQSHD